MSASRIEVASDGPLCEDGRWVLYWMTSARRTGWNFGLERAAMQAAELGKPLVVLEAFRCDYRYASERLHAFALAGMADNARACEEAGVLYYPYVEPRPGAGSGLLDALAQEACCVVGDRFPTGFMRRMVPASLARLDVHAVVVDSNGLLPLAATPRPFTRAYDFRRFFQRTFPAFVESGPLADPLSHYELAPPPALPTEITKRWPAAVPGRLAAKPARLAGLPIDHEVRATDVQGGSRAGTGVLKRFTDSGLQVYVEERNDPDDDGGSGLSPYLHFGHVGAWQVFEAVTRSGGWTPNALGDDASGARSGWWGLSEGAEAFLDQAVVWRELGYHFCHHVPDHAEYESLPEWAQVTLEAHAQDPRPASYDLEQLEAAESGDALWNAAQRQLVREGRIHNYLRMLWGKRILEWAPHPRAALEAMLYLNDRYALDGRDPNSISGITWCLGRFDRAWGPERPVFGKVRYMSSKNTARKLHVSRYLERYGDKVATA